MNYPETYRYTKEHEWVLAQGDTATIGITFHAQHELGDIVYVDLPKIGTKVETGKTFGSVESVKAVSELYSPVSGEVVDANVSLKDKPETLNSDPQGTWMIVVKLSQPSETAGLLDATQYADLVK